jgi:hypothetical protein
VNRIVRCLQMTAVLRSAIIVKGVFVILLRSGNGRCQRVYKAAEARGHSAARLRDTSNALQYGRPEPKRFKQPAQIGTCQKLLALCSFESAGRWFAPAFSEERSDAVTNEHDERRDTCPHSRSLPCTFFRQHSDDLECFTCSLLCI